MLLSLIFYAGFDQLASLDALKSQSLLVLNLGISEHYTSISRGVVDSRDVVYFVGLTCVSLAAARTAPSKPKLVSARRHDLLTWLGITGIVIASIAVSQFAFFRIDLTEDQRFSLNENTLDLIDRVEDPLLITLYLDGDFPSGFQRLREETRRMLDEFRARNGNIQYVFINPSGKP